MLVIRRVELSDEPVDLVGADIDVTRPYFLRVNYGVRGVGSSSSDAQLYIGGPDASLTGVHDFSVDCNVLDLPSSLQSGIVVNGARFYAVAETTDPGFTAVAIVFAYGV